MKKIQEIMRATSKGFHKGCFGNKKPNHYTKKEMKQLRKKK